MTTTKYRFITKEGHVYDRELPALVPSIYDTVPPTEEAVQKLARGIFDRRFLREATRRGEGNSGKALDIMWDRAKPAEKAAALLEAKEILEIRPDVRRFHWHKSSCAYIEQGSVFIDSTPRDKDDAITEALKKRKQQEMEKQMAMAAMQQAGFFTVNANGCQTIGISDASLKKTGKGVYEFTFVNATDWETLNAELLHGGSK